MPVALRDYWEAAKAAVRDGSLNFGEALHEQRLARDIIANPPRDLSPPEREKWAERIAARQADKIDYGTMPPQYAEQSPRETAVLPARADEPLSKAMADLPSADTIEANEIMRRVMARPDPPPETEQETRARRAADAADLREWKSYSSDSHETDGFDKIHDQNRSEPVDTKTAKAEIAHGKQDMRAAKLEQADAFWQQTINAGRLAQQAEPQKQPEKDKVAEPQQ